MKLIQEFGIDEDVSEIEVHHNTNIATQSCQIAVHLAHRYGDQAPAVIKAGPMTSVHSYVDHTKAHGDNCSRLHPKHPYIEAEVVQATKEYATTVTVCTLLKGLLSY